MSALRAMKQILDFLFFLFFKGLGEAVHNISQFISFFSPHFKGILQAKQKPEWAKVCSSSNDLLSTLKTFCLKAGDRCVHIWTYTRFIYFLPFQRGLCAASHYTFCSFCAPTEKCVNFWWFVLILIWTTLCTQTWKYMDIWINTIIVIWKCQLGI